ncbi:hypothetical protein BC834DRAFT_923325 [Gloeopeniophorella convolvens]|nr:hypothetical protein BC834DRAFT_923325 [Gloeopeniophorella convolvens]
MFTSQRLFRDVPCPQRVSCKRSPCLFSHDANAVFKLTQVPHELAPATPAPRQTVPAKRHAQADPQPTASSSRVAQSPSVERPTKLQKTGTTRRPAATPTASSTPTGVPILTINAGQSKIPVSTRQVCHPVLMLRYPQRVRRLPPSCPLCPPPSAASSSCYCMLIYWLFYLLSHIKTMLKTLYDHFVVLYDSVLPDNPSLASEHALRQEQEIYERTTKFTYRNTVITSIASLKGRSPPTSIVHPSVGTTGDLVARSKAVTIRNDLQLTTSHLLPLLLNLNELKQWNYIIDVPDEWGPGSEAPSAEGEVMTCERCKQRYTVRALSHDASISNACAYHPGKPLWMTTNGERVRTYTCCTRPLDDVFDRGCSRGPHVFYEGDAAQLHTRHSFAESLPSTSTTLDIAALDCEMVYTTGGFRVARVSVVDAHGKEVFDELIKMDDGVEVVDFNTRFSGIQPKDYAAKAVLSLDGVRRALGKLVGADTILLGHSLENDLRALRIVHRRVVDTVTLFPHPRGPPYRRALRDLSREFLGRGIQTGGPTVGHSSVEDSVATLDLVKWFVLNKKSKPSLGGGGKTPASWKT